MGGPSFRLQSKEASCSLREGCGGGERGKAEGRGGGTPVTHGTTPKPPAFCETPTLLLVWGTMHWTSSIFLLEKRKKERAEENAAVSILRGRGPG